MGTLLFWSIVIILAFFILTGFRIIDQYEEGVTLTFGKYTGTKRPGLRWIFWPLGIQRMIRIDMRVRTVNIPQQEVITKDNVTVGVNGVVYFQVIDSAHAVLHVQEYQDAVARYSQTSLRDIIGEVELDTLLSKREKIAADIRKAVDEVTDPWGVTISHIKLQDIELPADMKRVMARQAEAERERRATIIHASGELAASKELKQAADILATSPVGLPLRTLKTIENINPDPSKMVIFGPSLELFDGIKQHLGVDNSSTSAPKGTRSHR